MIAIFYLRILYFRLSRCFIFERLKAILSISNVTFEYDTLA